MKKIILAASFLFCSQLIFAQADLISKNDLSQLKEYEDTLALCSFIVVNDSFPENRFGTCRKLITTLVKALKNPNSFHYPFERLKSVSILYPPDSTFRVFTWQLYVDVDDYRYYGAIQMNSPGLKLFPLIDRSFEAENPEQATLAPEKWYGALYYNIRQFDTPAGRKYLLFGFDGFSFFNKRKLIDVLGLPDGQAVFGAPVFVETHPKTGQRTVRNRVLKEYSAEASFKLNFDETYDMILFDHLESLGGNYNQGMTNVPDGTYEGYKLENGQWNWVEQLPTQPLDEAPRPEPVLDERKGKDILGKQKKKGKGLP